MNVYRNMEVRSCNHWCCGKAINVPYTESVSVVVVIQHAMHMRRIIKRVINHKMCVLIFFTAFVQEIFYYKKN